MNRKQLQTVMELDSHRPQPTTAHRERQRQRSTSICAVEARRTRTYLNEEVVVGVGVQRRHRASWPDPCVDALDVALPERAVFWHLWTSIALYTGWVVRKHSTYKPTPKNWFDFCTTTEVAFVAVSAPGGDPGGKVTIAGAI